MAKPIKSYFLKFASVVFLTQSLLVSAQEVPTNYRKILAVLVNFRDAVHSTRPESVNDLLFTNPLSANAIIKQSSYNQLELTGHVIGPITIDATASEGDRTQWSDKTDILLKEQAIDIGSYDTVMYLFPGGTGPIATFGGSPARIWMGEHLDSPVVYAHELGHNLGMGHSGVDGDNDGYTEERLRHGDYSDFMGAEGPFNYSQVNAPHRIQMNWLPQKNIRHAHTNGDFVLSALEIYPHSSDLVQAIVIPVTGTSEVYVLSYRKRVGFDSHLADRFVGRLQIHRQNKDLMETRFITSLGDGDIFRDRILNLSIEQISSSENQTRLSIRYRPRLEPPGYWTERNINTPMAGSVKYESDNITGHAFTLFSAGRDIWQASDSFFYYSSPVSANFEMTARIRSQRNTHPWAKAGLMVRSSDYQRNAPFVFVGLTPENGFVLQARRDTGSDALHLAQKPSYAESNNWIRLRKQDDMVTGYISQDGINWTELGSFQCDKDVRFKNLGLATTSAHDQTLNRTIFDHVQWREF